MSKNLEQALQSIDQGLETPHERHVRILRDITELALLKAAEDNNFDYGDAEETISICETWVDRRTC